jgi:hypothetical protein
MLKRLRKLGIVLMVMGLGLVAAGGIAFYKVQAGYDSLQAFSAEQNVTLAYNEDGQLTDRGTTEGAAAIMALLTEDWKYPVVESDLDPNDPLVDTATEYMYQMATITYHTLNGTQIVTLTEDAEFNGELFAAGTYEVPVDGRYWTDFNRSHPLDAIAREKAWTGTAHGLIAELGVGTLTHSALQMGLALAGAFAAMGLMGLLTGAGMIWVSRGGLIEVPTTRRIRKELATEFDEVEELVEV